MFQQQHQQINIDPETTTCVFRHPKFDIYFCDEADTGFTQDLRLASKYFGADARMRGVKKMQDRFPDIKEGMVLFQYISNE